MNTNADTPHWRILIVDNEERTRQEHYENLQGEGYELFVAHGQGQDLLADAEHQAQHHRCHLALVDMRLLDDGEQTDTSGLDLVERLKPTVSIVVTGYARKAYYAEKARQKGALHTLDKGDPTALRDMVRETLEECGYRDIEIKWKASLNELRIARHLFPENPKQFREEAADVLRRLFNKAEGLDVTLLDTVDDPLSLTLRPGSLVIKVTEAGKDLPYLVKIGRCGRIETEISNYNKHIRMRGPGEAPVAPHGTRSLWSLGGTVYSYVGNFTDQRPTLFSDWYKAPDRNLQEIEEALKALYQQWRGHYHRKFSETSYATIAYSDVWDRNKDGEKWLAKLVKRQESFSKLSVPSSLSHLSLPNPVDWLISKLAITSDGAFVDPTTQPTTLSVTHGDMHGDNFFVIRPSGVWVIDYERTGKGYVLQDWVELEHDILTRLTLFQSNEWQFYVHLVCAIAQPDIVSQWSAGKIRSLSRVIANPQMIKSLKVINIVRRLARESDEGSGDARPYVWGLLLNAIFRIIIWKKEYDEPKLQEESDEAYAQRRQKLCYGIQRCFVLAGVLCHRLENWNTRWPPKGWIVEATAGQVQTSEPDAIPFPLNPILKLQLTDLRNDQGGFKVAALGILNQEPRATSMLPYTGDKLIAVMKLLETGKYTPDGFNDAQTPALRQLGLLKGESLIHNWCDQVGHDLFTALAPAEGGVRREFENVFHTHRRGGQLQLIFDKDTTDLACQPWEVLHDGFPEEPRSPINTDRYIASGRTAQTLTAPAEPCRILYVAVRPRGYTQPAYDREAIQASVAASESTGRFKFTELERHTHTALKERLLDTGQPDVHVLHFDGHGAFARLCPSCGVLNQPHYLTCQNKKKACNASLVNSPACGYLLFETDAGEVDFIDTTKFLDGIQRSEVRLVVLSSCQSARVRGADLLLAGVGPGLILAGIPAVVAMQFSISDKDAIQFNDALYKALAQGDSLPNAVYRARTMLDEPARWSPVLYLRSRDGQIHLCPQK